MKPAAKKVISSVLPLVIFVLILALIIGGGVFALFRYVDTHPAGGEDSEFTLPDADGWHPSIRYDGRLYTTEARLPVLDDTTGLKQVGVIESRVNWDKEPRKDNQTNGDMVGYLIFQFEGDRDHIYIKKEDSEESERYITYVVDSLLWSEVLGKTAK